MYIKHRSLNVEIIGSGKVTSNPGVINCSSNVGVCYYQFSLNTPVNLDASPIGGSSFVKWDGDCTGSAPSTSVTMSKDKTCTATFNGGGANSCSNPPRHYFCANGTAVTGVSETQQWVWSCGGERCVEQKKAPWYYED